MRWLTILLLGLWASIARAEYHDGKTEVDLELLLLVDVSRSMSPAEQEIQRRGYAEALASDDVIEAILGGLTGRIALSYVEWAGSYSIRTVVDWTLIGAAEDARAFADGIGTSQLASMQRTSISGALRFGMVTLRDNDFRGLRRVIDISGDGPNNEGGPVVPDRNRAVAEGIIINGLPLMTRDGQGSRWYLEDLDEYYRACVIGGPGAFVLPVLRWEEFAPAIKRKLILEIAGRQPERLWRAQATAPAGYDCLVGEKRWERMRRIYDLP
ncbi:DUF1194 domain-containing protein [Palleronia pelagia]|uniref:VWFA domain-containing protein n=1 Tax=Palleronia pelagia TaxID=387096 RepID=A0A1H8GM16_9RHOB|nr:DUF1194 domain-containing protein [Palleronia pelagia]SEN45013.1 Protein of unknown function [Palleronia pelagia]